MKEKLTTAVAIDHPAAAEILVSFPDKWELVHKMMRGDTPLYIAGMPPSEEEPRRDHFYGLPVEINLEVSTYRQYKMFEPWQMPSFYVSWDDAAGAGRVEKPKDLKIQLQQLGQAQAWYGKQHGVIWECYFHETRRRAKTWEEELAAFWQTVERDMAVGKVFTEPREPTFEEGFTKFLNRLGYSPDPDYPRWWSKPSEE